MKLFWQTPISRSSYSYCAAASYCTIQQKEQQHHHQHEEPKIEDLTQDIKGMQTLPEVLLVKDLPVASKMTSKTTTHSSRSSGSWNESE